MGVVGAAMSSQFVISNGDNFYDTGLKGTEDPRFSSSFSDVYTDPSLMTQWYASKFGFYHVCFHVPAYSICTTILIQRHTNIYVYH